MISAMTMIHAINVIMVPAVASVGTAMRTAPTMNATTIVLIICIKSPLVVNPSFITRFQLFPSRYIYHPGGTTHYCIFTVARRMWVRSDVRQHIRSSFPKQMSMFLIMVVQTSRSSHKTSRIAFSFVKSHLVHSFGICMSAFLPDDVRNSNL